MAHCRYAGGPDKFMNNALASLGQPIHPASAMMRFIGDGVFTFASRALAGDAQNLVDEVVRRMREHTEATT